MNIVRLLLLTLFLQSTALAQETPKLTYAPALVELHKYQLLLKSLDKIHAAEVLALAARQDVEIKVIRDRTIMKLRGFQTLATIDNQLDLALALRAAIKRLKAIPKDPFNEELLAGATKFGGHRYLGIYRFNISWQDANDFCKKMGGHLATVDNQKEYEFIKGFVGQGARDNNLWIGGQRIKGNWQWTHGGRVSLELFNKGRPYRHLPQANFLYFSSIGHVGDAGSPHKNIPGFICEWDH